MRIRLWKAQLSFTAFLTAWERLGYLGPEIWMLEPFLDRATGHLDADSSQRKPSAGRSGLARSRFRQAAAGLLPRISQ